MNLDWTPLIGVAVPLPCGSSGRSHLFAGKSPIFHKVKAVIESLVGGLILEGDARKHAGLDHPRAGDLIALAEEMLGFHYFRKRMRPELPAGWIYTGSGYDPVFICDPMIPFPNIKAVQTYRQKLALNPHGFNTVYVNLGVVTELSPGIRQTGHMVMVHLILKFWNQPRSMT